jgi:hypothetical protein
MWQNMKNKSPFGQKNYLPEHLQPATCLYAGFVLYLYVVVFLEDAQDTSKHIIRSIVLRISNLFFFITLSLWFGFCRDL